MISAILPATLHARPWKEAGSDRTLEGDYVRTEGDQVVIRKSGGSTIKIAVSKLSEEDQKFVASQAPAKEEASADKDVFKWETDFELAKQRAKDEKKDLLAPLLPGMEQPPHPMMLGDDDTAYYRGEFRSSGGEA